MDVAAWLEWYLGGLLRAYCGHKERSPRYWQHWAAIAKCSQDTALRDVPELLERGVLMKSEASGRSTSYESVVVEVLH